MSYEWASRNILTNKIAFALMYDQRIQLEHLDSDDAAVILNYVMDWLDLYLCSQTAFPIWADKLSAAILSSKENIMRSVVDNPFPWLLFGFKVRSIPIYQEGMRYAVGYYLRRIYPDRKLMLQLLDGEQMLLNIIEEESYRVSDVVKRLEENFQVLAAGYNGKDLRRHLPFLVQTKIQEDANLVWLHWLNTTLLNTDDRHRLAWDYDDGMAFGSNYSNDGKHGSRPGWILPTVARRLDRGEVHEQELLEQWKSSTENHTELPNMSQDDELRPELAKILAKASYRIHELFKWHNGTALTFGERDDQVFDTYRCLDFRGHTYPWESEAPWSIYEPNVGLSENSTYWSASESEKYYPDYDQESDEDRWNGMW
jgi:hypothetical protein